MDKQRLLEWLLAAVIGLLGGTEIAPRPAVSVTPSSVEVQIHEALGPINARLDHIDSQISVLVDRSNRNIK